MKRLVTVFLLGLCLSGCFKRPRLDVNPETAEMLNQVTADYADLRQRYEDLQSKLVATAKNLAESEAERRDLEGDLKFYRDAFGNALKVQRTVNPTGK